MKHCHFYVYILANKNNTTLYIGVTNDLERRIYEHKSGIYKGFSQKYKTKKLVYFEMFENTEEAISREKQLKNWRREWKEDLIKEKNLHWKDLSLSWFDDENRVSLSDSSLPMLMAFLVMTLSSG